MSLSSSGTPAWSGLTRPALAVLILGSLVRVFLLAAFAEPTAPASIASILARGLGHDLVVAACSLTLLLVAASAGRVVLKAWLWLFSFVLLLVSIAEIFFWNEFQSRPDRLVFHYLSYPREVLTFLEDQFLLSLYALPFLLLVALVYRWLASALSETVLSTRASMAAVGFCLGCGMVLAAIPIDVGRVSAQLASNAYFGVLSAALTNESRWQGRYPEPEPNHPLPKFVPQTPWQQPPKHLVLIIEESFAGPTWLDRVQRQRYLPRFVELEARSWSFNNVFATGSRTTRGMEALLNGVPPLPGVSTTQRPNPERLPSLPRALGRAGWDTVFVYAGWPNFSDLSAYWRAIGFAATTSREDFHPDAGHFETSWGFADETLFARLLTEMDSRTAKHERVFAATLTVSHHRPFDYPPGRVPFPADERRSEYAMAYADWALGDFLASAAKRDWYNDTLFVIAGDHGARFFGNASIPVNAYRVPLVFYAPGRMQAKSLDQLGSLMEVPGTLLDLLRVADTEGFFGTHLLDASQSTVPVEHDYDLGLVDAAGVTVLKRGAAPERWQWQSLSQAQSLEPSAADTHAVQTAAKLFHQAFQRYFNRSP